MPRTSGSRTSGAPRTSGGRRAPIFVAAALLATVAMLIGSGILLRATHTGRSAAHERAEFIAAARQAVVTLLSVDAEQADRQAQRIIDNSTGSFKDDFTFAADDFVRMARDAGVSTTVTAAAAAVERMANDSAVVLVAATSTVTDAAGTAEPPQHWRLAVELRREGDQIKMSGVEFVS